MTPSNRFAPGLAASLGAAGSATNRTPLIETAPRLSLGPGLSIRAASNARRRALLYAEPRHGPS